MKVTGQIQFVIVQIQSVMPGRNPVCNSRNPVCYVSIKVQNWFEAVCFGFLCGLKGVLYPLNWANNEHYFTFQKKAECVLCAQSVMGIRLQNGLSKSVGNRSIYMITRP